MTTMYEFFRTDETAERDGIILDYGMFRITVARAGGANKAYQRELERLSRPLRRAIAAELLENEQAMQLLREVYARSVVKNWELKQDDSWVPGIEAPDGSTLPVTSENILATFNALPELFADVMAQAGKAALYRASLREQAEGN